MAEILGRARPIETVDLNPAATKRPSPAGGMPRLLPCATAPPA